MTVASLLVASGSTQGSESLWIENGNDSARMLLLLCFQLQFARARQQCACISLAGLHSKLSRPDLLVCIFPRG